MFDVSVSCSLLFLGVFLQAITLRHITGRMEAQSPVLTTTRYGGTRVLFEILSVELTSVTLWKLTLLKVAFKDRWRFFYLRKKKTTWKIKCRTENIVLIHIMWHSVCLKSVWLLLSRTFILVAYMLISCVFTQADFHPTSRSGFYPRSPFSSGSIPNYLCYFIPTLTCRACSSAPSQMKRNWMFIFEF